MVVEEEQEKGRNYVRVRKKIVTAGGFTSLNDYANILS